MRLVRTVLSETLSPDDYEILTAADGRTAIEIAVDSQPEVILLDLEMPILNGEETLQLLKECESTREIPVLMVTSEDDDDKICKLLELGAADYIKKPFSSSVTRARVRNAIRASRALKTVWEMHSALEKRVDERTSELKSALFDAQSATRSKSEFLANMSHELRTPLTAILGFTETILMEGDIEKAPKERVEAIKTVMDNGERLLDLINGILDLSKIEAGKIEFEALEVSPFKVVEDVIQLLRVKASEKNLTLEARYLNNLPKVMLTDPTRLYQVLVNLVGNAIKFTKKGGVTIEVSSVQMENKVQFQFDVVDTGVGLTDIQISNVFAPFAQADSSTTRKFGGSGLGLTISHRLAEILGGSLNVESNLGIGSRFRLMITPDVSDETCWISPESYANQRDAKANAEFSEKWNNEDRLVGRILLVEDGPDNQRLISFILRKAGAEVELAENGLVGYEKAMQAIDDGQPYDIILTDMQMPVLDGYGAATKLRDSGCTIPIIALTAHAMAGEKQKCIDAGCTDYSTKPINRKALVSMIAHYTRPSVENA